MAINSESSYHSFKYIPFFGGAENGKFILFGHENISLGEEDLIEHVKIFDYLGIKNGDIILDIEGQNICGYRRKDVLEYLQNLNKDCGNLIINYVEKDSGFPQDLHTFLCQKFVKGSQEHALQQQIRENLYLRTVPCTTREPRPCEVNGVDYTFVTFDEFCHLQRTGQLIEYGVYEGNLYGTPRPNGDNNLESKKILFTDASASAGNQQRFIETFSFHEENSANGSTDDHPKPDPHEQEDAILRVRIPTPITTITKEIPVTSRKLDDNNNSPCGSIATKTPTPSPPLNYLSINPVITTSFTPPLPPCTLAAAASAVIETSTSGGCKNDSSGDSVETLNSLRSLNSILLEEEGGRLEPSFSPSLSPGSATKSNDVFRTAHHPHLHNSNSAWISPPPPDSSVNEIYQPLTIGHQPNSIKRNASFKAITPVVRPSEQHAFPDQEKMPCVTVAKNFIDASPPLMLPLSPPPLPMTVTKCDALEKRDSSYSFRNNNNNYYNGDEDYCNQDNGVGYSRKNYAATLKANNTKQQSNNHLNNSTFVSPSLYGLRFTKNPLDLTASTSLSSITTVQTTTPGKLFGFHLTKGPGGFGFTILGHSERDRDFLFINKILAGGPASLDGNLVKGDILVYVDSGCVLGYSHNDILTLLQGIPVGQTIQIIVCRGSSYNATFAQTQLKLSTRHQHPLGKRTGSSKGGNTSLEDPNVITRSFEYDFDPSSRNTNSNTCFSNKTLPHRFKLHDRAGNETASEAFVFDALKPTASNSTSSKISSDAHVHLPSLPNNVENDKAKQNGGGSTIYQDFFGLRKLKLFTTKNAQEDFSRTASNLTWAPLPSSNEAETTAVITSRDDALNGDQTLTTNQTTTSLFSHTPVKTCKNIFPPTSAKKPSTIDHLYHRSPQVIKNDLKGHHIDTFEYFNGHTLNGYASEGISKNITNGHSTNSNLSSPNSFYDSSDDKVEGQGGGTLTCITVTRKSLKEGFGFIILSSMDGKSGSFINKILENSPASRCSDLKVGQKILAINGIDIRNRRNDDLYDKEYPSSAAQKYKEGHFTHQQIVELIKRSGLSLKLLLQDISSVSPPKSAVINKDIQTENLSKQTTDDSSFTRFASKIKKQSTFRDDLKLFPPAQSQATRENHAKYYREHFSDADVRYPNSNRPKDILLPPSNFKGKLENLVQLIELYKGTRGFGFSIRGGSEFRDMPLYVYGIAEDGPAHKDSRLQVGDEIIEINGRPTEGMTHSEALTLIKSWEHMVRILIVRKQQPAGNPQHKFNGHHDFHEMNEEKEDPNIILNPKKLVLTRNVYYDDNGYCNPKKFFNNNNQWNSYLEPVAAVPSIAYLNGY